jgi:hypothetical protein
VSAAAGDADAAGWLLAASVPSWGLDRVVSGRAAIDARYRPFQHQHDESETAMTTIPLPDDLPDEGPARVPLVSLARSPLSPVLTRIVQRPAERGPGRVVVAAFQSSV